MTNRPPKPVGNTGRIRLLRWLYDMAMANRITSVVGGVLRRTDSGVQLVFTPGTGGAPASAGLNFRGEYVTTESYVKNDVVVIFTGNNVGTYVCVQDRPGSSNAPVAYSDPAHGTYWVSLPFGNALGSW